MRRLCADGQFDDASIEIIASAQRREAAEGLIVVQVTNCPSALETILCLMTRMSPGRSLCL